MSTGEEGEGERCGGESVDLISDAAKRRLSRSCGGVGRRQLNHVEPERQTDASLRSHQIGPIECGISRSRETTAHQLQSTHATHPPYLERSPVTLQIAVLPFDSCFHSYIDYRNRRTISSRIPYCKLSHRIASHLIASHLIASHHLQVRTRSQAGLLIASRSLPPSDHPPS